MFERFSLELIALWLTIALLTATKTVSIGGITSSAINFIKVLTITCGFVSRQLNRLPNAHLSFQALVLIPPWILRTIYRKTSTADEMFGAEFLSQHEFERRRSITASAIPYAETLETAALASAPSYEDEISISFPDDKKIPYAQSVFALDPSFSLSAQEYAEAWYEKPPT